MLITDSTKLTRLGADKLSKIELVRLQGVAGGNDLMVAGTKDDLLMRLRR